MSKTTKFLICMAAYATVSWAPGGIAFAAEPVFYQVRILNKQENQLGSGDQKLRLTKFVERLRAELMVDNLGEANIGCDRCGELVTAEKVEGLVAPNRPLTSLEFTLLRNGSQLEAFARSFDFVQASELGAGAFTMEIDGTAPGSSACSTSQLNAGCKNRPLCVQTNGCDKPYGGACDLCPTS